MTASGSGDQDDGGTPVRDAACLILADRTQDEPRLLMGRRHASQVFLPNKWVFPGGRVEDDDRAFTALLAETSGLMRSANHSLEAKRGLIQLPFALTAIRETFEETGLFLGRTSAEVVTGLPPAWQKIIDLGLQPDFEGFRPLARAITPPGNPRRFDTWFFIANWHPDSGVIGQPDGELLDLGWFTLAEVRGLDLPNITRLIVDDVASLVDQAPAPASGTLIPFYFQDVDGYQRTLIDGRGPFLSALTGGV